MVENLEADLIERFKDARCEYCGTDFDVKSWNSEWSDDNENHYKCVICHECGKKDCVKVHFSGSGHDTVTSGEMTQLESTVRKVGLE